LLVFGEFWRGMGARVMAHSLDRFDAVFRYYQPLERVKNYVDQELSGDISLKSAAQVAGLETKYFSAYFHKKTGMCFKDWLAQIRVDRAIKLMKTQDYTISEIAYAVGYRDLRTFERAFKRCTGATPHAYKKSVQPVGGRFLSQHTRF
jgi:two-component system response regulator YesN